MRAQRAEIQAAGGPDGLASRDPGQGRPAAGSVLKQGSFRRQQQPIRSEGR